MKWCVNFDSILHNFDNIVGFDEQMKPYTGPTLFLNGSLSIRHDEQVYKRLFPNAILETVEGAGHYVYTDNAKVALLSIATFLD